MGKFVSLAAKELKELRQARPVSMQLSESYLKALDIL